MLKYENFLYICIHTLIFIYKKPMIHTLLCTIADRMNEFLLSYYERSEVMAEAGIIDAASNEEQADKIVLSLLSIERETAMGINNAYKNTSSALVRQSPPWHLNINIMIAAVFTSQRYIESLKILSDCISFLQQNSIIQLPDGQKITLEPVTLTPQELSNAWSILGGHYYPSVLCKARMLTFDGSEIRKTSRRVTSEKVN